MRRRPAVALAVLAAAACGAEVIALSGHLRAERRAADQRTQAAREALARPGFEVRSRARAKEREMLCLRDVDTAAVAVAEARGDRPALPSAKALARLSERALVAERAIERAGGLPQRLGRERTVRGWETLEPRTVSCDGRPATARVPMPPQSDLPGATGAE